MLIDCVECGREVSDTAETCPGCGAGVRMSLPWYVRMFRPTRRERDVTEKLLKALPMYLVVGFLVYLFWGPSSKVEPQPSGLERDGALVALSGADRKAHVAWMRSVGLNCDYLHELRYRGPGAYGEQYLAYCLNGAEFYITEQPNGQRTGRARGVLDQFSDAFRSGLAAGAKRK